MELQAVLDLLREPPPRPVTPELMRACESESRPMLMWGGVALASTGGFYSIVFGALHAPWQILAGATATAATGLALLLAFAAVTVRLRRLLGHGRLVTGEVVAVRPPRRRPSSGPAFGRVTYRFRAPEGGTFTGSGRLAWIPPPPEPGQPVQLCVLPGRPRQHLPLISGSP